MMIFYNRRFLIAMVGMLWLVVMMLYSAPQTDSETIILYSQITKALTQSTYYGHKSLSQSPFFTVARDKKFFSLDFPFIIDSPQVCTRSKPFLLITVMSLHNNIAQRTAIRETYGRLARNGEWPGRKIKEDVRMIFLFGVSNSTKDNKIIEKEANIFKDIVFVDFIESYYNLTYKVLMGFKWAETYCPNAQFIIKADEDTFMDLPRLIDVLKSINMKNHIYGHFHYADSVERIGKSKVVKEAYPLSVYAPHVKGNMYGMNTKLAVQIMKLAQYLPYVNMEDAHLTGNVAKLLGVRHYEIPEDQYDFSRPSKLCEFVLGRKIISQQVNASYAYRVWKTIENPSLCKS